MKKIYFTVSMISFMFAALSTQIFISCKTTKINDVLINEDSVAMAVIDDGELVDQYVEYMNERQAYLIRKGKTDSGDCILERYPLTPIDDQLYIRWGGKGETCRGKGCTYCAFKAGGGCECKNSENMCEHKISRVRDVFILR